MLLAKQRQNKIYEKIRGNSALRLSTYWSARIHGHSRLKNNAYGGLRLRLSLRRRT